MSFFYYYRYLSVKENAFVFIVLPGQQVNCSAVRCESFSRKLTKCTVDGMETITRVPNIRLMTSNPCTFRDSLPMSDTDNKGIYGFEDNYIWVANNCRAIFTACGDIGIGKGISRCS